MRCTCPLSRSWSAGVRTASGAVFHVDVKRQLVVIMTRNRYGKNQDRYSGQMWKALDAGIVKE